MKYELGLIQVKIFIPANISIEKIITLALRLPGSNNKFQVFSTRLKGDNVKRLCS